MNKVVVCESVRKSSNCSVEMRVKCRIIDKKSFDIPGKTNILLLIVSKEKIYMNEDKYNKNTFIPTNEYECIYVPVWFYDIWILIIHNHNANNSLYCNNSPNHFH